MAQEINKFQIEARRYYKLAETAKNQKEREKWLRHAKNTVALAHDAETRQHNVNACMPDDTEMVFANTLELLKN